MLRARLPAKQYFMPFGRQAQIDRYKQRTFQLHLAGKMRARQTSRQGGKDCDASTKSEVVLRPFTYRVDPDNTSNLIIGTQEFRAIATRCDVTGWIKRKRSTKNIKYHPKTINVTRNDNGT